MDLKCSEGYVMDKETWMCERVTCDRGWKLEGGLCVRVVCPKGYRLVGDGSCRASCGDAEGEIVRDGKCWNVKSGCGLRDGCRMSNLELLEVWVGSIKREQDRLREKFIRRNLQRVVNKPAGFDQK